MRYSSTINNVKASEWGLTIQQAYLFSWFYELPSWANKVMIENEIYFFASKTKAVEELPILTDKTDTMYRYYKQLEELELITIKKIDSKDYISLTAKGKTWNFSKSEHSENNPSIVGNSSENNSENNPTYNIYNTNNKIKDNALILFSVSSWNNLETLREKLLLDKEFIKEFKGVDLKSYIEDVLAWSISTNKKRTDNGWYMTLRQWMKRDLKSNKLHKLPIKPKTINPENQSNYQNF